MEWAVLKMYCKFANVSFWKPTVTFWELRTNLTQEMYKNIYCTVFFIQLLMREAEKEPDREILHNVKC